MPWKAAILNAYAKKIAHQKIKAIINITYGFY
jgi:hypothetical protein